jgi:hypothetical protein
LFSCSKQVNNKGRCLSFRFQRESKLFEEENRTINEATKAMIHDQHLPMILWAEASMTAVYGQNRSPHHILKNMTPEEAFTIVKPEVGHFRIFGCPVYLHVPKEKRSKIDPSGRKGTFVGYSDLQRLTGSTSLVRDRLR